MATQILDAREKARSHEPQNIDGVTAESFHAWLYHHPAGKVFRKYLEDVAKDNQAVAVEAWLSGKGTQPVADEMRGVINTQVNHAKIRFEEIYGFYQMMRERQEVERRNAAAIDEEQARDLQAG
jgi:hypothetical protein